MVSGAATLMAAMMVMGAPAMAHDLFDPNNDEEEDLDTIDVGPLECLVEDGDDVKFCVNEDTGERVHVFYSGLQCG